MESNILGEFDLEKSGVNINQLVCIFSVFKHVDSFDIVHTGYKPSIVGGFIRDLALGGKVNDIDIYCHAPDKLHFVTSMENEFSHVPYTITNITEKSYFYNVGCIDNVLRYTFTKDTYLNIDLVTCNSSCVEYAQTFDFSLNQFIWGTDGIYALRQAIKDYNNNVLRCLNPNAKTVDRTRNLLRKYAFLNYYGPDGVCRRKAF